MADKESTLDPNLNKIESEISEILMTSSIDEEIERARNHFYGVLMDKKRHIRRSFLQMNAITNEYLLETLSYRTMAQPLITENDGATSEEELQINNYEIDTKTPMPTFCQNCNICDSPTICEEGIGPQIDNVSISEEQDGWLDSETDLEIQQILNEETTS